jgi:hypothetical protein
MHVIRPTSNGFGRDGFGRVGGGSWLGRWLRNAPAFVAHFGVATRLRSDTCAVNTLGAKLTAPVQYLSTLGIVALVLAGHARVLDAANGTGIFIPDRLCSCLRAAAKFVGARILGARGGTGSRGQGGRVGTGRCTTHAGGAARGCARRD